MTYNELPKADLYEQLAEEATELAQACLKMSRRLRGTNPTPLSENEISKMVTEELTDVTNLVSLLQLEIDPDILVSKRARWNERLANLSSEKTKSKKSWPRDPFGREVSFRSHFLQF